MTLPTAPRQELSIDRGPFLVHADGSRFTVICRTDGVSAGKLVLKWRPVGGSAFAQAEEISRPGGRDHVFRAEGKISGADDAELVIADADGRMLPIVPAKDDAALPYLFNPGGRSVSVGWKTAEEVGGAVEYRESGRDETKKTLDLSSGTPVTGRCHVVTLTGLRPGTAYEYRVIAVDPLSGRESGGSGWYRFRTLKEGDAELRMVFFSDIHADIETFAALSKHLEPEKADFVVLAGDLCWDGVWQSAETIFFGDFLKFSAAAFAARVPTVFMRGNHEWAGSRSFEWTKWFPAENGKTYGMFRAGCCCFILLDTGPIGNFPPGSPAGDYMAEQRRWLEERVLPSETFRDAAFRIVLAHMPTHGIPNAPLLEKSFADLFNRGGVQLMLVGHVHRYLRIDRGGDGCYGTDYYAIWGEDQPPRTALDKRYTLVINGGGPDEGGRYATALEVRAGKEHVTVRAISRDGSVGDAFRVFPDGRVENMMETKKFPFRGKYRK